ncbi:chromatin remodelling complex Rsc7/Swp82 subunit-domain-containing protein [Pseudomassariella vexata]|uniref:Chromatin remodelling complex Rsc7/Swp82 subunit-domain-containing protein n=1 Tax=Pseudomassariella vexata TaxID=1141098 RepID=A0A1Y2DS21_9PEZI|nr:chromatin remodelling complex Rsc7/Swp82 subunit-domain-containing protein [Pseudomassariella vexata]ORY62078.1 chromatin remodelling complex Rsc7/Swp82 subunit-domain-containing protein [Pseudomassariella vexata]
MYSTEPNGAEGATINPATINPAALNSELVNPNARGLKRSRSPESYQDAQPSGTPGDDGSDKPRKRGRPMKPRSSGGLPDPPNQTPHMMPPMQQQQQQQQQHMPPQQTMTPQTPQSRNAPLPGQAGNYTPAQPQISPPPKTTPTKTTLKALPTVRDHTTDQLGPGGDEYIPRETDEAGEKKVMPNGQLLGSREYRCRTFLVPNRGDKLFMLATECARVLGYRDSYLLFNKNRSLFKIIANQIEKDDLVQQEILPFSYRSRQIAIVTARSMFRQFGSRVIVNGRRVRDDYWEGKARKQGFTEADLAGEKRPGGANKVREAAAEAANNPPAMVGGPHGEIVYANPPGHFGGAPQPQLVQPDMNDTRTRDYSNYIKGGPRQEIAGSAYQDRTQPSPLAEIHAQAHYTAEFNRSVNQGREMRTDYIQNLWRRPHEQPSSAAPATTTDASVPQTTQAGQSPHVSNATMQQPTSGMVPNQSPQMMMTAPPYSQSMHAQQPISQAPLRGMPQASNQKQSRQPSLQSSVPSNLPQGQPQYNYGAQNPMWAQHPQTPQTPQQYSGYTTQAQQSPHPQQSPAPQLRHPSGTPQMQPATMQYPGMPAMQQGYPNSGQGMYPPDQTPRQFMPQNPSGAPAVTQGWSNPQTSTTGNWWANQPQ